VSPADGTQYPSAQLITITANAATPSGSILQVEFFVNGTSIGVDNTLPYSIDYTFPGDGNYEIEARATNSAGKVSLACYISTVIVGNPPVTVQIPVTASSDDAEENISNGAMDLTSSDLEIIRDAGLSRNQEVGIRFINVNVPKNAVINYAYIQFQCDETGNLNLSGQTTSTFTIYTHNVGNSGTFTSSAYNVSSRAKSTTSVSWTTPNWNVVGERGVNQRTAELKSLVELLLARADWSQGNPMTFIITGTNGTSRIAESFDGTAAPLLVINYTVPLNPLSVSKINLKVKKETKRVVLNWEFLSTEKTNKVLVERSSNGKDFETIGVVNSDIKGKFIDNNPLDGSNYYRINVDGNYSETQYINFKNGFNLNIYPNPKDKNDLLQLVFTETPEDLYILDIQGKEVKVEYELSASNHYIIKNKLPQGVYFVVASKGNEKVTKKLVVN
jgi:hypothetical protein